MCCAASKKGNEDTGSFWTSLLQNVNVKHQKGNKNVGAAEISAGTQCLRGADKLHLREGKGKKREGKGRDRERERGREREKDREKERERGRKGKKKRKEKERKRKGN